MLKPPKNKWQVRSKISIYATVTVMASDSMKAKKTAGKIMLQNLTPVLRSNNYSVCIERVSARRAK